MLVTCCPLVRSVFAALINRATTARASVHRKRRSKSNQERVVGIVNHARVVFGALLPIPDGDRYRNAGLMLFDGIRTTDFSRLWLRMITVPTCFSIIHPCSIWIPNSCTALSDVNFCRSSLLSNAARKRSMSIRLDCWNG